VLHRAIASELPKRSVEPSYAAVMAKIHV
jgi:hypothetical protein